MTASRASQDGESTCESQLLNANRFKMGALTKWQFISAI